MKKSLFILYTLLILSNPVFSDDSQLAKLLCLATEEEKKKDPDRVTLADIKKRVYKHAAVMSYIFNAIYGDLLKCYKGKKIVEASFIDGYIREIIKILISKDVEKNTHITKRWYRKLIKEIAKFKPILKKMDICRAYHREDLIETQYKPLLKKQLKAFKKFITHPEKTSKKKKRKR